MLITRIDIDNIDSKLLEEPAKIIREGGTVAFPTETVYGLGANALMPYAVDNIFKAKGRPNDNPLIVHISDVSQVDGLVSEVPKKAKILMEKFWPGPLTIIMKKADVVPDNVTAGLETVGIRFPQNPVAKEFLRLAGVPVAAPSANTSGRPSPTSVKHVIEDLYGKIDAVIDGGHSKFGLESTIIDMSGDLPTVLRPGSVTVEMLRDAIGEVSVDPAILHMPEEGMIAKAPGMKYKHYAPNVEVVVVKGKGEHVSMYINRCIEEKHKNGAKVGAMVYRQILADISGADVLRDLGDINHRSTAAHSLFSILRMFETAGVSVVYAQDGGEGGLGLAISNRLNKAAGYKIVDLG